MTLTKPQLAMLAMASSLGGEMHVFPDQRRIVTSLETLGLMLGNGKYINRMSSITLEGRRALKQSRSQSQEDRK